MNELFVSPLGNDQWSGRLPSPNREGTDGPLASLGAARDAVGRLKMAGMASWPFTVYLRGGRYAMTEPVVFSQQDSGPITYCAYRNEKPLLDGAQEIAGFVATKLKNGMSAWVADVPEVKAGRWNFRSLFVNGERRPRTLLPKSGTYEIVDVPGITRDAKLFEGTTSFIARKDDVREYRNLSDVDVLIPHYWVEERMPIASWEVETGELTSTCRSIFALRAGYGPEWARYQLENVFEALDSPGQWYLDRAPGKLYYLPKPGEKIGKTTVMAPRVRQVIKLTGDVAAGQHVEYLSFRGLTIANTDWQQSKGVVPDHDRIPDVLMGSDAQAAVGVEGVIDGVATRYCSFEDLTIHTTGEYAFNFTEACVGNRIIGCHLHDLGGGGAKVYGAAIARPAGEYSSHFQITDNHIHDIGEVFKPAIGVITCHAFGMVIAHNHIHHTHYSGVSVGWVWGYAASVSRDNMIENNHIHHIGKGVLSDMGGIYTLGVQPGTVIRGNLIHDVRSAEYGGWAIYPDEGSSHMIIENNICYDTDCSCFNVHYGRELIARNNIFAFGHECLVTLGRSEDHSSFTLTGNIIVTDGQPIHQGGYNNKTFERITFKSDHNLLFDTTAKTPLGGSKFKEAHYSLSLMKEKGVEVHSVVGDPLFKDLAKRNFTLAPNSPALKLGFEQIDMSKVGPRQRGSAQVIR